MKPSIPVRRWTTGAESPPQGDRIFPGRQGLEFTKEIWEALVEGGWHPKGVSRDLPYDFLLQEDPAIHVICKAIAGPHGWYEAIGRACFCMFSEPHAKTIIAVPHAGRFLETVSYFCKKNDLCVGTPNTIASDVAMLTRGPAAAHAGDASSAGEGAIDPDHPDVHF